MTKELQELAKKYNLDLELLAKIIQMKNEGKTFEAIGTQLDLNKRTITRYWDKIQLINTANPTDFWKLVIGLLIIGTGVYLLQEQTKRKPVAVVKGKDGKG